MDKMEFLNTKIDNVTMTEAIEKIRSFIKDGKYHYVVTPNVDHIIKLEYDKEFQEIYKNADLILVDGQPLMWIGKYLNRPIKEKVSGSDLFPNVCEMAAKENYSVFLLGAAEGVAALAAKNLCNRFKGLNIAGVYSPSFGFEKKEDEIEKIIEMINNLKPDILCVGVGAPKQEKFIFKYKDRLKVPVSLAIGGSIDFESGIKKRAPKWMQKSGLEGVYRFCKEPRRMFKRCFIDDMGIFKLVFKYRKQKRK
ncbi:MAG: WecB/TagA/CpsF family glycosyltransferase [Bacillota bacterium]|nr:WecB/TagA/CpsF family glycosyltransferase [Bacillota bacterium]